MRSAPRVIMSVALGAVLFSGCASTRVNFVPITTGKLITEGCVITAEDGSFRIESGKMFESPFTCRQYTERKYSDESTQSSYKYIFEDIDIVGGSDRALENGAQKVRVSVPDLLDPLYGVLLLGGAPENARGPAARSYLIQIPDKYVEQAQMGRISVVYEYVEVESGVSKQTLPTWALWLSDQRFYP